MPVTVKMPDGKYIQMPDNPTPNELAQLQLMASPSAQGQVQGETAPSEPSPPDAGIEAGKGAARGLASMGQAVSGVFQGATVGGQPVNPLQNPEIQRLGEHFTSMMGRNPDASPEQHAWGTAGEIAGGALMGAPGGKAGLSLFEKATPKAAQLATPQLSMLQEIIADKVGGAAGTMIGGGTLGRMVARYGMRAVMKALQKVPEEAGAAGSSSGGGLSPEALARISASGVQPLFSQGEQ